MDQIEEVIVEDTAFRTGKWVLIFFATYFTFTLMHEKTLAGDAALLRYHAYCQTLLFVFVAAIPAYVTKVMWWVDFAWPLGLCYMAVFFYVQNNSKGIRCSIICSLLFLHGFRMVVGAVYAIISGSWTTTKDLPRYDYQRLRSQILQNNWQVAMQIDILIQLLANTSFLVVPIYFISNSSFEFSIIEVGALVLWIFGFIWENIADYTKLLFIRKNANKNIVCNIGLWRYCRHPNFFGEWLLWLSYAFGAFVNLPGIRDDGKYIFGSGYIIMCTPLLMYYCLVYYTGAVPAEYYSIQKRPDYREYKRSTNMFWPWIPHSKEGIDKRRKKEKRNM